MGVLGAAATAIGGKAFAASTLGKAISTIGAMQAAGRGNNSSNQGGLSSWITAVQNQQQDQAPQNTTQVPSILELAKTGTQFPNVRSAATYFTPNVATGTTTQNQGMNQGMNDLWAKQLINQRYEGVQGG